MEDTTIAEKINNNGNLDSVFAVFDGHGGHIVSIFCKIIFPIVLEWNINNSLDLKNEDKIKNSLKKSIKDIDWIL